MEDYIEIPFPKGYNSIIDFLRTLGQKDLKTFLEYNKNITNLNSVSPGLTIRIPQSWIPSESIPAAGISADYSKMDFNNLPDNVKKKVLAYTSDYLNNKIKFKDIPPQLQQQVFNQSIRLKSNKAAKGVGVGAGVLAATLAGASAAPIIAEAIPGIAAAATKAGGLDMAAYNYFKSLPWGTRAALGFLTSGAIDKGIEETSDKKYKGWANMLYKGSGLKGFIDNKIAKTDQGRSNWLGIIETPLAFTNPAILVPNILATGLLLKNIANEFKPAAQTVKTYFTNAANSAREGAQAVGQSLGLTLHIVPEVSNEQKAVAARAAWDEAKRAFDAMRAGSGVKYTGSTVSKGLNKTGTVVARGNSYASNVSPKGSYGNLGYYVKLNTPQIEIPEVPPVPVVNPTPVVPVGDLPIEPPLIPGILPSFESLWKSKTPNPQYTIVPRQVPQYSTQETQVFNPWFDVPVSPEHYAKVVTGNMDNPNNRFWLYGEAPIGQTINDLPIMSESIRSGRGAATPGVVVVPGNPTGSTPSGAFSGFGTYYGPEGGSWVDENGQPIPIEEIMKALQAAQTPTE